MYQGAFIKLIIYVGKYYGGIIGSYCYRIEHANTKAKGLLFSGVFIIACYSIYIHILDDPVFHLLFSVNVIITGYNIWSE